MRPRIIGVVLLTSIATLMAVTATPAQSPFCRATTPTCPPPSFSFLDVPTDNQIVRRSEWLQIGGWGFQCARAIEYYAIEVDGLFIGAEHFSTREPTPAPRLIVNYRPDVKAAFAEWVPGCQVTGWSGFGALFEPNFFTAGPHTIRVWMLTPRWVDVAPTWQPTPKVTIWVRP